MPSLRDLQQLPAIRRRRGGRGGELGTLVMCGLVAIGIIRFWRPDAQFDRAPFAALMRPSSALVATASPTAFGLSGGVNLRTALPGSIVQFPVAVGGSTDSISYRWIPVSTGVGDSASGRAPFIDSNLVAPSRPGFYRLLLTRGVVDQVITEPTLAVMVPFASKVRGFLNGYRIGTYLAERFTQHPEHPQGFLEVSPDMLDLPVSRHVRLGDFVTHDAQVDVWPKYVALDPRLLDKLELIISKVASWRGADSTSAMALDVHSGFRTPAYNAHVLWAARDSRHEYGDAADIAIDADDDGRITLLDERLVAKAVDEVEAEHPELVGGMGLYTSRRYRSPYVHIDVRGKKSRWWG